MAPQEETQDRVSQEEIQDKWIRAVATSHSDSLESMEQVFVNGLNDEEKAAFRKFQRRHESTYENGVLTMKKGKETITVDQNNKKVTIAGKRSNSEAEYDDVGEETTKTVDETAKKGRTTTHTSTTYEGDSVKKTVEESKKKGLFGRTTVDTVTSYEGDQETGKKVEETTKRARSTTHTSTTYEGDSVKKTVEESRKKGLFGRTTVDTVTNYEDNQETSKTQTITKKRANGKEEKVEVTTRNDGTSVESKFYSDGPYKGKKMSEINYDADHKPTSQSIIEYNSKGSTTKIEELGEDGKPTGKTTTENRDKQGVLTETKEFDKQTGKTVVITYDYAKGTKTVTRDGASAEEPLSEEELKQHQKTLNTINNTDENIASFSDNPNSLGGREGKQGELEEEMWRLAWKNKLLAFDHNKDDAEFPFVQCLPDTMKTISDDPKCVSMELKNGTKLLNSANGICMDHNGKPTIEDAMTMVRLGKEKGISKAKIDPNASPEFKKQTYIAMLAQGIEVANIEQLGFSKDQLAELNNEANKLKEKSANDLGRAEEMDKNYPNLGMENNVEKFEKFSKEDYQSLKDSLAQGKTGEKEQELADKGTQEKEPQEKETQNEVLNDVTVERLDKETGITHLETFKNGKVVSDSTFDKDGKALEDKTWDESGKPLSEKTYAADGVNPAKEVVYDYDGEKLTGRVETEYNQDGTYKTSIYDAEGKVVPDKGKQPQEQAAEPKASQKNAVQQMEDFQKEVSKEMNLTKDGKEGDYSAGQVEAGYNSISEDKKKNLSQKFGTIVLKFCEQYPEQAKKLAEDLKKPENASFAMKMKTLGNAFNSVKGQEVSGRTKAEKEDKKLRADILKSLQGDRAK